MSEYLEKLRSIGVSKGLKSRQTVQREKNATIITTERSEGQDVVVRPDTVDYKAIRHNTGKKRGQVAEIKKKGTR